MFNIVKKIGWETFSDSVKFTWDSTFFDALGPRDAIEIKPKSNTECTCFCNGTSDWIMSKSFDGISCDILSEIDFINYIAFSWVTCSFMQLAMLQFETKLQKRIRMGITIFKIFILGLISSDNLKSYFTRIPVKLNFQPLSNNICPQMDILNTVIP